MKKTVKKNKAVSTGIVKYKPRSIAPIDPIKKYIMEVNKYPLLTKEEEELLIKQIKKSNDMKAVKKLLMAHLRLVVKIAFEYYNQYYVSLFDLIQEGNLGIIMAVKKFDPSKKVRFSTYAQWWIKAYILKSLMDNYSIIRIGRSRVEKRLFYSLKKAKDKLLEAGIDPDNITKLAEYMNEDEKDVIDMSKRMKEGVISLDQSVGKEDNRSLISMVPADYVNIEKEAIKKDMDEKLHDKLKEFSRFLNEKEYFIYQHRMLSEEPWSLQKIGDKYNISRERVRQIGEKISKKLKDYLSRQKDIKVKDLLVNE